MMPLESDDFDHVVDGLVRRTDEPHLPLAPTRNLRTSRAEGVLADRKLAFISLAEDVALVGRRKLRLRRPLDGTLCWFRAAHLLAPATTGVKGLAY